MDLHANANVPSFDITKAKKRSKGWPTTKRQSELVMHTTWNKSVIYFIHGSIIRYKILLNYALVSTKTKNRLRSPTTAEMKKQMSFKNPYNFRVFHFSQLEFNTDRAMFLRAASWHTWIILLWSDAKILYRKHEERGGRGDRSAVKDF